jgi:acetyl/propionyl-CoA carboxylase alpha subunit
MEVSIYYDPMIAKLITFGADRTEAIARMKRAMSEYRISGVQTTIDFAQFVMDHEAFVSGDFDTHFVANYYTPESINNGNTELESVGAMALSNLLQQQKETQHTNTSNGQSRWKQNRS